MINEKWQRYIAASINKHFSTEIQLLDPTINVYVEGQHRTDTVPTKIVEVRFDGPYWRELHKDSFQGIVEINNLIQFKMDDSDNYKIWDIIGKVSRTMTMCIPVYNYENPPIPLVQIGHLQRLSNKDDVQIHYFGQIDQVDKIQQATCEAHYHIDLVGI
jgi:hypothetical protein